MAHADYDCCAICDSKMGYAGLDEATTKEGICELCLVNLRDIGLHILTVEELTSWIDKTEAEEVRETLSRLRFMFCYYFNPIDKAVRDKGIEPVERRIDNEISTNTS
ncbi:hypothetical protein ES703_119044 [subsurface metagenome]